MGFGTRSCCAIEGCVASRTSHHRLPNPEKYPALFHLWIKVSGRVDLLKSSPKRVFDHIRVCRKHFAESSFGRNNKLLRTAYPTLHLPGNIY